MLQQNHYVTDSISVCFCESTYLTGQIAHDETSALLYFVIDEDAEVLSIDLDAYGLSAPQSQGWIKIGEHTGVANQLIDLHFLSYKATAFVGPSSHQRNLLKSSG